MKYSTHSQYYNQEGVEIPSVTTILKVLNKPALVKWANIMGFKRRSTDEILENAGSIGTEMHECIERYFKKEKYQLPEEKYHLRDTLLKRLDGFLSWVKTIETITPLMLEAKLEGDTFGGTMDFYGMVDGLETILDFKTSSRVHGSMFLQLGGYIYIMETFLNKKVKQVGIVHITESGTKVVMKNRKEMEKYVQCFLQLAGLFHSWYSISDEDGWEKII